MKKFKSTDEISLKKIDTKEEKDFVEYWLNHPDEGFKLDQPLRLNISLNSAKLLLKYLVGLKERNRQTFIIVKEEKKIGFCGLQSIDYTNGKSHSFCFIKPDYRNQGYGTDALRMVLEHGFEQLRLNKIYAEDDLDNKPAIKMNKELGYKKEGILRDHLFKEGEYKDFMLLSILKEEWQQNKH